MNILLVLIPVTLLIVLVAVVVFFWAVNHQQFDDMDSPAVLPLMEDDPAADPAPMETPGTVPSNTPPHAIHATGRPPAQP